MKTSKKIHSKNIRATALEEFWGTEYDRDIYLWEGAKNNLTLSEIDQIETSTINDIFVTPDEVSNAFNECKKIYFKFSELLAEKLNEIHKTNLPVSFWRTALGYWLFRHIHIVYEKYSYLSRIDIDKTSIKLLDKKSFFIPNDPHEHLRCFCSDFGVQQLVSQYYYIFKNVDFPIKEATFDIKPNVVKSKKKKSKFTVLKNIVLIKGILFRIITQILPFFRKPKIILLRVNYSTILKPLLIKSKIKIQPYILPRFNNPIGDTNEIKRQEFLNIKYDNNFELYLINTFYYCFPKILIEKFKNYHDVFEIDIKKKQFNYIVSEGWITNLPLSIYIAIAQNNNKKFICQEHSAFGYLLLNNYLWYELLVLDKYLTTGWRIDNPNVIQGGMSSKKITLYQFKKSKKNILFISHVRFPYLMEFGVNNAINSNYLKSLRIVDEFINLLPKKFISNFLLRPRIGDKYFWDTEFAWDVKKRNINIDKGNFTESIQQSKIVIIDHISSGLAKILLMNAPFLLIFDNEISIIADEFKDVFSELTHCGVVHNNARSATEQLSTIYDDVESWWKSEHVQTSINLFRSTFLAPSSKTIDYLLSCLNK